MKCTRKLVNLPYTDRQLRRLFRWALDLDLRKGGQFDARSAAINFWSRDWGTDENKVNSELLYTWYFAWGTKPRLWAAEWCTGRSVVDCFRALGDLELRALGEVAYGTAEGEVL